MKQTATVIEVKDDTAVVEVIRQAACEGCKMSGACHSCGKTVTATVKNKLGALPGDTVEVEAPSGTILKYAVIVFVLPVVAALLSYYIAAAILTDEVIPYLAALVAFLLSFAVIYFYSNSRAAEDSRMEITRMIQDTHRRIDS